MGAGDRLRELDSRLLPALARRVSRLGHGPARLRLLAGAGLASVLAVLATAFWAVDRAPPATGPNPALMRVGVVQGQSVAGYERSSRAELAGLLHPPDGAAVPAQLYALVSLTAYLAPEKLAPVLSGAGAQQVYVRAPLGGIQTQVVRIPVFRVPDDVAAGMLEAAQRRDREQGEFRRLEVALHGDGANQQRLRRAYDNAAQIAAAEAAAYRAGCSCVFAAVVYATPAALERIAGHAEVRVVDPAPEVRRLDRVEFRPPLPEQHTVVSQPPTEPEPLRPVPPASSQALSPRQSTARGGGRREARGGPGRRGAL